MSQSMTLLERRTADQRLDVLIYAHDGCGWGHVSRSVAIALAVQRIAPGLRTALISGSGRVAALAGDREIEHVKLPSYSNSVMGGMLRPQACPSGLSYDQVARLRRLALKMWVAILRPRCVLVDHVPGGKEGELLGALRCPAGRLATWLLGVRAIPGDVPELWSKESRALVRAKFSGILWYGDAALLGRYESAHLSRCFGVSVVETGYVCRLRELAADLEVATIERTYFCTVNLVWRSDRTETLLNALVDVFERIGDKFGRWRIRLSKEVRDGSVAFVECCRRYAFVDLAGISTENARRVFESKMMIVHAGYNSISDLLWSRTPALLVVRQTDEREQEQHAAALELLCEGAITCVRENDVTSDGLLAILPRLAESRAWKAAVNVSGADHAALALVKAVGNSGVKHARETASAYSEQGNGV